MSLPASPQRETAVALQVDRALQGLAPSDEAELAALLDQDPMLQDDGFEFAAAALDCGHQWRQDLEPLPASLTARLQASLPARAPTAARVIQGPGSWWGQLGWVAAAACLVWIAFGSRGDRQSEPDPVRQFEALVAEAPDLQRLPWTATEDPAATSLRGELSWSPTLQRGFMHIEGLERNDPTQRQYQLWIFDRNQEHPVDGGVFDITQDDQWIPIDAKIRVGEAWQFAVTVERPGGVVVSDKERIVALAAP